MQKILLANIGNRNITYKGKSKSVILQGDEAHFRNGTEYLLNQYFEEKQYIQANILPPLIEDLKSNLQTIYLFGSNQPEGEWNIQDTVYEAYLLQKMFCELYPEIEVVVLEITCRVVDINALMKYYRDVLNNLFQKHPEDQFIICDAGGTTQQKTSLKIIAEYLLKDECFEMYNINYINGKSILEKIKSLEYRRVIDQEQINALINQYDYLGAKTIYTGNRRNVTDALSNYLSIAALLFSNESDNAAGLALHPTKELIKNELIKSIGEYSFYDRAIEKWNSLFTQSVIFKLCLILDIAACFHKLKDWGFTTLYYHIFLERFLNEVVAPFTGVSDLSKNWVKVRTEIIEGRLFSGITVLADRQVSETYSASVPVLVDLAKNLKNELVDEVLNSIKAEHLSLFSGNRNKFAHEGRPLKQENVKFLFSTFNKWHSQFHLSSVTIFDKINKDLNNLLKY